MNGTPGFPIDLCGQRFHRSSSKLLISDFLKPVLAHVRKSEDIVIVKALQLKQFLSTEITANQSK